jgi:DnaA family protein
MIDQLTLNIRLQDETDFDNYFAGDNEEVVIALREMILSEKPGCIYIAGNKGVGKSHLLQACCQFAASFGLQSFYLPIEVGLSTLILEDLETFSLVCFDDVDKIVGNRNWEEAIFHFFNRSLQHRSHILFASETLPKQLQFILPDLASRLASALTYFLKPLTDSQKVEMLQLRARIRGFEINKEVVQYLLNHYPREMNSLLELFEQLDQASLKAKHKLTVPFVKSVLT